MQHFLLAFNPFNQSLPWTWPRSWMAISNLDIISRDISLSTKEHDEKCENVRALKSFLGRWLTYWTNLDFWTSPKSCWSKYWQERYFKSFIKIPDSFYMSHPAYDSHDMNHMIWFTFEILKSDSLRYVLDRNVLPAAYRLEAGFHYLWVIHDSWTMIHTVWLTDNE